MKTRIDKDSYILIACLCVMALALMFVSLRFIPWKWLSFPLAAFFAVFFFFVIWFHRVPVRSSDAPANAVTSVADGRVVVVEKAFEKEFLKRDCIQVSVYMNFFDVHANFWPVSGEISHYQYHPGKYLLAFHPKASELNEHSSTVIKSEYGDVFFKQIAGTFARRIVCYSKVGDKVERNNQCGIIKFGSRIDMFLPLDADIKVKPGDECRACETVIAEL